ncbi:MAG: UDP-N-acetylmuramoylalanine--D-glutamate ligase [Anaerosolibacter sp.]|jgi:UDP-N-acetylmuramoylalanine--D-glutamate ligase|uniref:UDP-N-acetylmuramoyl-L-alanine--D-glutamate ligase n=1 Tax=Anaerosolibacter sp. TaxID=1872527 RepID=UPI002618FFA5|nr:UDP-N-acetylmuramoyl-L-alanine--D-glutamate ligase [Anaerosolibacter sp.]MDF2546894.1 UDP-N-acetylmuramoylalanine--D-glutamate ligase [Anaerosolibacter sp.]
MILKDKRVLVVGLATSGIPTVNTLIRQGAKVTVNDVKNEEQLREIISALSMYDVRYILGGHPEDVTQYDILVLSPGVPTDLPFIHKAKENGILIVGELELAYRLCKGKFIAITGTNGKTTTTALTGEIFHNAEKETYVVGNIGVAAISKALEASKEAVMVTEVSSFQLESIIDFKPHIAAILNITPDHLNRHKTMENYIAAKANIFKNQEACDFVVLNADNEETYALASKTTSQVIPFSRKSSFDQGVFVVNGDIVVKEKGKEPMVVCSTKELNIPGNHNLENALAATALAYWGGIDIQSIANTLKSFKGVEHRTEIIAEIQGVCFINDSKGTNPDASIAAIKGMETPIILIAGGMDKGSEFDELIEAFEGKVKHMILLGETANKIKETAEQLGFVSCTMVGSMEEAVKQAYKQSIKGDTVLLSPACASWDMYESYEHRGRHFKDCVESLRRSL